MFRILDYVVDRFLSLGMWLGLPLVGLLFLQWPLRDIVGAYSSEANDLGQWIFALYVAVSVTAATRARLHLATDVLARRYPSSWRRHLARAGAAVGLIPWAVFVLATSKPVVLASILLLERFPDTSNPGYFVVKLSLWILAGLVLLEGVAELFRNVPTSGE